MIRSPFTFTLSSDLDFRLHFNGPQVKWEKEIPSGFDSLIAETYSNVTSLSFSRSVGNGSKFCLEIQGPLLRVKCCTFPA